MSLSIAPMLSPQWLGLARKTSTVVLMNNLRRRLELAEQVRRHLLLLWPSAVTPSANPLKLAGMPSRWPLCAMERLAGVKKTAISGSTVQVLMAWPRPSVAEAVRRVGCVISEVWARRVKMEAAKGFRVAMALAILSAGSSCNAQSYSSTGTSWSSSWGYSTAADRSVGLATAQAIQLQKAGTATPVYNTYNNTNTTSSVGSMNTGTTSIQITGDQNTVTAPIGADNTGCVDGSLSTSTVDGMNSFPLGPIDVTALGLNTVIKCPG